MVVELFLLLGSPTAVPPPSPASAPPTAPATPPPSAQPMNKVVTVERWGGRQSVIGHRKIPLLGTFEMRTDIWVLASVRRVGDDWEIEQTTCNVLVGDVAGVSVRFPDGVLPRLPSVSFSVRRDADGFYTIAPWRSGWDATDFDRDGWGGLTLTIDAPMCDGRLAVVSDSMSSGRVRVATREALELDLEVRVGQHTLETDGWCLKFADDQTDDRFIGRARYDPLPAAATCRDVLAMPPALPLPPP